MRWAIPKINLSIQLIAIFAFTLLCGHLLPVALKSVCLALSQSIMALLIFILPFIIFSCLFYSLVSNQSQALKFVIVLLLLVCLSNFISLIAVYGMSIAMLSHIPLNTMQSVDIQTALAPLWSLKLPMWIPVEWSLILGLALGLFFSFIPSKWPLKVGTAGNRLVTFTLQKLFIPLLPLVSLGFLLKMEHEGILSKVLISYAPIIGIIFLCNLVYVIAMFWVAAKFRWKAFVGYLKNIIAPSISAFTSMSSLATMPLTLEATKKNTNNPVLSQAVIPATVNIHMIGDSMTIPVVIMAILLTFGMPLPSFAQYFVFVQYYMLAKFAVPGVPCGSIFVIVPILENCFGFTSEMAAFLAAIFVLFDPILTTGNVLGNNALAIIFTRVMEWQPFRKAAAVEKPASL